jgi:GNAT superfamily N-acetyltransferase
MSHPVLRQANEVEAPLLAALIAASFADVAARFALTRDNCPAHASFVTAKDVRTGFSFGSAFWLSFDDDRACGCIAFRKPKDGVAVLEKLAVLSAFRRRGIGSVLMERACTESRLAGAGIAEVGIIAEHGELRAWYEKIGFEYFKSARFDLLPFEVAYLRKSLES